MARPGMTEGTPADGSPETQRLDLDPGRNVSTAQFGNAGAQPGAGIDRGRPSQPELDDAQAEARRDASPASYQQTEKTERKKPTAGLLLIGGAVVIIVVALLVFLR